MKATSFLLLVLLALATASNETVNQSNLTNDQPSNAVYTVHVIPHTHDDIGWLKTIDQYYFTSMKNITNQGVQYILDSVFPMLEEDPTKKFIYVEIGFFRRWWDEQDNNTQQAVLNLSKSGQFEFINGGYCMNDEASVYYEDSIDQMTLGHKFILDVFNTTPTIGWHIDPFGHAAAQASLFAQMGFNAFYFWRVDREDHELRNKTQAMEMVWIPETSQGVENAIFTHLNYNGYGDPPGFCFDIICGDDPIMDDPNLGYYNLDVKGQTLVDYYKTMANAYQSDTFMHTAGGDFNWMAAEHNFKNWDKLFNYINPQTDKFGLNLTYSTPSQYLAAVHPLNLTYPVKTDDFFPYSDGPNAFWTGYFVSRVSLKGLVRETGKLLQATRRLATQAVWSKSSTYVSNNWKDIDSALGQLEEAMAANQHHDAVTGTSKQAVAEDYKHYLSNGTDVVRQKFLIPYFQERAQQELNLKGLKYEACHLNATASLCNVTYQNMNSPVLVTVYNSGPSRRSIVKVKVPHGRIQVSATDGLYLPTDVVCPNRTDPSDCLLVFTAYLNAYSVAHYYIIPISGSNRVTPQALDGNFAALNLSVNSNQTLTVNNLTSFTVTYCSDSTRKTCTDTPFTLNYNYYEGFVGNNDQPSGAYIFRPSNKTLNASIPYDTPTTANVYAGRNHLHIRLYGNKTMTDMRIYRDIATGIEVETFVDSIDITDGVGKEVVMVVNVPSINNNNTFYTDSMGMELQKRVVNFRPTWNYTEINQPVSGNYYPVQSTILINDTTTNASLAIIPDRAQAGGSINNGQIEIMIHRRLLYDDWRGVDEPLNETDTDDQGMRQWITHTFLFNQPNYAKTNHRAIQQLRDMPVISMYAPTTQTPTIQSVENTLGADNFASLDPNIKIISRPTSPTSFLLRFQNMDEVNSRTVSTSFFNSTLGNATVTEMSLSANQAKATMIKNRYDWNGLGLNNPDFINNDYIISNVFLLRPLEIRTFTVTFGAKEGVERVEEQYEETGDDEIITV